MAGRLGSIRAPRPFVDELEGRLDRRAAGREARQDLAHRLDRLVVGRDRQLDPGTLGRGALVGRAGLAHDRASLTRSRRPLPFAVDRLAGVGGVRLEQLALLLRQLGRHGDADEHVEVAALVGPAEVGHALAAQPDLGAGLGAGLDLERLLAVGRRDRHRRPERGLGDRHLLLVEQLGAVALEDGVRLDVDRDVQVAGRAAARTRPRPRPTAGSGGPRRCPAGIATRSVRLRSVRPSPRQVSHGRLDDLALALAARAGRDVDHLAEHRGADRAELARCRRTGGRSSVEVPGSAPDALARLAAAERRELDLLLGPADRLGEGDPEVVAQVRAGRRSGRRRAAAGRGPAEERVEDVAEARRSRPTPGPPAPPLTPARPNMS